MLAVPAVGLIATESFSASPEGTSAATLSRLGAAPQDAVPFVYTPLDQDADEIRVITFSSSANSHGPIQCQLETVSLRDVTPRYQSFLSALELPSPTKRMIQARWKIAMSQEAYSVRTDSQTCGDLFRRYTPGNFVADDEYPAQVDVTNRTHLGLSARLGSSTKDCVTLTEHLHRFSWGDFAALSYVWGETLAGTARQIYVNGHIVTVGQNLETALRSLCNSSEFTGRYKVWVDAICINQSDLEERGRQVAKMRAIYGDAWSVIAWLGKEDHESDKAIELLWSLSQASRQGLGAELEQKLLENHKVLGEGSWLALETLMQRDYWFRLWIIQEVVLGSYAVTVRCGNASIDWSSFCHGVKFLYDSLWLTKDLLLRHDISVKGLTGRRSRSWATSSLHLVHRDLWALSRYEAEGYETQQTTRFSFRQLLDLAISAKSSDARDKVYGLVGLMDARITKILAPDYTSTPAKVFANVAKLFITSFGTLDPIQEGNPWGKARAPSWAADWAWESRTQASRPMRAILRYHTSGSSPAKALFSDDNLHLSCQGFVIDKVDGLAARGDGNYQWSQSSIVQPTHQKSNAYGCTREISKAIYCTLMGDRGQDGHKAKEHLAAILSLPSTFEAALPQFQALGWKWFSAQGDYYWRWSRWRCANADFLVAGQRFDDYFTDEIPQSAIESEHQEAYTVYDRTRKGRRLMTTEKGCVGWAPNNIYGNGEDQTKQGDFIAIVFGCSTPVVIRPQGDFFLVVGGAYVHGLMDGEAMKSPESGLYKSQTFTFC